jgi:branched-chain amino acid aminotransferase
VTGDVWINGSFEGRIGAADRGLTLGDGVFDTLTAFRRMPFAGDRHLGRLVSQAASIGIALDAGVVRAGWDAILRRAETEHVILRTTVTRGVTGRGLWPASARQPTVIVSATPWSAALLGQPMRLVTSSIVRNAGSPAARLKSLGYLDNVLASREAADAGATDALFLNAAGMATCTTIANVFAVMGRRLVTPSVADGVMPGIVRALVLEGAEEVGLAASEQSLRTQDLLEAEAVFTTNSVRFVCPVESLDGKPLGRDRDGVAARIAGTIKARIRKTCGFEPGAGS